MAKVQQKSEKISAFGGIFFVLDRFDRILSSVIDSHLGLRSKLIGYQYSEIIRAIFSVILQSVVIWSRSFGQNQFRERGHCSLYINIYLYYSGGFWQSVFDFDKWPNDQMTAQDKNRQNNLGYVFVDRNGNVVPLHCQKWATRHIADSKTPARWKRNAETLIKGKVNSEKWKICYRLNLNSKH